MHGNEIYPKRYLNKFFAFARSSVVFDIALFFLADLLISERDNQQNSITFRILVNKYTRYSNDSHPYRFTYLRKGQ
jgi:hypothetical protein